MPIPATNPGPLYTDSGPGAEQADVILHSIEAAISTSDKDLLIFQDPVIQDTLARDGTWSNMLGALSGRFAFMTLGDATLESVSEGTASTPTDWTTGHVEAQPARMAASRVASDWGRARTEGLMVGRLADGYLAAVTIDAMKMIATKIVRMIGLLAPQADMIFGTSGARVTYAAVSELPLRLANRGGGGGASGFMLIGNLNFFLQLRQDCLALGGAAADTEFVKAMVDLDPAMRGYIGRGPGGIRMYMSDGVATDGDDAYAVVVSTDGLIITFHTVPLQSPAIALVQSALFTIEERRSNGGVTIHETVIHMGVGTRQQEGIASFLYANQE